MGDTRGVRDGDGVDEEASAPIVDEAMADALLARAEAEGMELLGPEGLLGQMTKAVLERALGEELTGHLGYEPHQRAGPSNWRNGTTPKRLITEAGSVELDVPRDRNGSLDPKIVPKGHRLVDGIDRLVISLYARGMTVRDIQHHMAGIYDVTVSPDLISKITDGVLEEVREWQSRPLDAAPCIRSSSSTRSCARSATRAPCATRPPTWQPGSTSRLQGSPAPTPAAPTPRTRHEPPTDASPRP
jgi:putative transposase